MLIFQKAKNDVIFFLNVSGRTLKKSRRFDSFVVVYGTASKDRKVSGRETAARKEQGTAKVS